MGDPRRADNVGTIKNLAIVHAQCVTRGLAADPDALYLVEVTDARGILHNRWFQAPLTAAYNVRAPAYPDVFYAASLNTGAAWSWTALLADVWARAATVAPHLGAWPGIPAGLVPSGVPEGFRFPGVPAWYALCDTIEHLGLVVACDPTHAAPYTLVGNGAADQTFAAQQARYATNLEDDLEWVDIGAGRAPGTVEVLFRKRYAVYGVEETVRYDLPQWESTPYYAVTSTTSAAAAGAPGVHYIWSDFTVRYDQDGSPFATDVAAAQAIAAERAAEYFRGVYYQTSGFMAQTYAGALPFATGSQVGGVCWHQDYGDYPRQGWLTRIVRGPNPPFAEVCE